MSSKDRFASVRPTYLTLRQTAEWLSVSSRTVRRLIERGELPGYQLGKRKIIRVKWEDVEALLEPIGHGGKEASQ